MSFQEYEALTSINQGSSNFVWCPYPFSFLLFVSFLTKGFLFHQETSKSISLIQSLVLLSCQTMYLRQVGPVAVWGTEYLPICQVIGFQLPKEACLPLLEATEVLIYCLHCNKNLSFQDGTFLVRDSSKKTITNPYVLMVLYKDKVYNIQIRYQEESQVYVLGTGLRGKEDFLSVSDIIDYFRKMPLLLIDGKNRGSRYQCTLTHSAVCPQQVSQAHEPSSCLCCQHEKMRQTW